MAVKLRLKRFGRRNKPFFRICAFDVRTKRDGESLEDLGHYAPRAAENKSSVNVERAKFWLDRGAQMSEAVKNILKRAGVALPQRKRRKAKKTAAAK